MFSEDEKNTARAIVANKSYMALLEKILIEPQRQWSSEVIALSNEGLGELVKADVLADDKIRQRFAKLKNFGAVERVESAPVAPK